ncbi:MAG: DUF3187 family protein [Candidatus Omnitrophota bacterium]
MKRKTAAVAAFFMLFFLPVCCVFAENTGEERAVIKNNGPIPIRNQMPLYLLYMQMAPDKASVVGRDGFEINADYTVSNITVSAFTPATSLYDIQIDLEVSRVTIDLRYGIYDNLEVGLEIPYISLSSGYLDNFVESIEDGIGARTPRSRERQGSYEFDYSLRYNNNYLIQQKHSSDGLGDMIIDAKYQLIRDQDLSWPNLSLRSAVKLPTADKDDLLGSGEFDFGVGLLVDKKLFNSLYLYTGANVVFIKKPSFLSELDIDNHIFSGMMAIEYFLTDRFSFITQVSGNSTPYPSSGTNPLDNDAFELCMGINYALKEKTDLSWNFAIAENIKSASSPDVTFSTGLSWRI